MKIDSIETTGREIQEQIFEYQVGGSLPNEFAFYVSRKADEQFYEGLKSSEFCYVFSSRQMGKSSLKIRTMKKLQSDGILCVAMEIPEFGANNVPEDQWYGGIIDYIVYSLGMENQFDFNNWWNRQNHLSPVRRFGKFIEEELLKLTDRRIVIFIDEIDSVFKLDFNVEDFFAFIRTCYNKRGDNPEYKRITFAILGVASPTDLIQDKRRTPFNIGREIELTGLHVKDALPLAKGFSTKVQNHEKLLRAILNLTDGQPFLTQKVCKLIREEDSEISDNEEIHVEKVIDKKVIENWETQDDPVHLRTIRDRLLWKNGKDVNRVLLRLELYHRVLREEWIPSDDSTEQIELRLTGLVTKDKAKLRVTNYIYRRIFNIDWVEQNRIQFEKTDSKRKLMIWKEQIRGLILKWNESKRNSRFLLRGSQLVDAEINFERYRDELREVEKDFIEESVEERKREKINSEHVRREKEAANYNLSIVRILFSGTIDTRHPLGSGFLISARHILTCARVVAGAFGISPRERDIPKQPVFLDFPLLSQKTIFSAQVIKWFPIRELSDENADEIENIAVLEISPDELLPKDSRAAPFMISAPNIFFDRPVRMYGFPKGMENGEWVAGKLQGVTGRGWVQVDHDLNRRSLASGYSGTPVWDTDENAVAGMLFSITSRDKTTSAYMIPATTLVKAFPELDQLNRPPNPYRGLEAFREEDSPYFFGRDKTLRKLNKAVQKYPFVAVIGHSGSGKSSLIFAGLAPQLKETGKWIITNFRPMKEPFNAFVAALIPLLYKDEFEQTKKLMSFTTEVETGVIELSELVSIVIKKHRGKQLLLILDQYEELYSLNPDKDLQHRFIDALLKTLTIPDFTILIAIRADFMGQVITYAPFAAVLNNYHKEFLTPIDEDEFRNIIQKPAEISGVTLESGLTDLIIKEIGNEPGSLPLLQFALTELWEKQTFRQLTHEAYLRIGGVNQALASHANAVYEKFSDEDRKRLRTIFIHLVRPGEGTEDTRQIASRTMFNQEDWDLIIRLADKRLVVTGRNEESGDETVEIVNEALVRYWGYLRKWMYEDREFQVWKSNFTQAMRAWVQTGKDNGALLRGVRLVEAEEKVRERGDVFSPLEIEFIRDGIGMREREILEKDRLQKRASRTLLVALIILMLSMGGWLVRDTIQGQKLELSLIQTKAAKEKAEEKVIEARHSLGFMFHEKSERELGNKNFNAAKIYALHALKSFDPIRSGVERSMTIGGVLSHQDCPIRFSSPVGSHHDGSVMSVSYSPDGRTLATGSEDTVIRLWNVETGKEKASLTGHTADVRSIIFSPDGKMLASGASDNTIRLWDVSTRKGKILMTGHTSSVRSVSFSPDGKTLASGADDKTIRLWDVSTGKEKRLLSGHTESVRSVDFSSDGKILASGADDKTIRLWDVTTGKEKRLTGHTDSVKSVNFSPNGKTLASGADDKTIRLWDVSTGKGKRLLAGHTESVRSVDFSPKGQILASGANDNTIRLWDVSTGKEKGLMTGHTSSVISVSFSPIGNSLASGADDKTIRLWDVSTGKEKGMITGHTDSVISVSFSTDGKTLASGAYDNTIRLWDVSTGKEKEILTGHKNYFRSVSFSPDGKTLASGASDNAIRLWDVSTGKEKGLMTRHTSSVRSVSFSPDGKILASGASDNTIRLWDVSTGKEKGLLTGHTDSVRSVSFSPDGKTTASGSSDKTIRLWDVTTGKEKVLMSGHTDTVRSVSFSPDGKTLASGSDDKTIRLWDVSAGKEKGLLAGHTDSVISVSFSLDGKTLASGAEDTTIRLWDLKTGKEKGLLTGHTSSVISVSFSPIGNYLASGAYDKTIRLWDVSTGKERSLITGHTDSVTSVSFSPDGKALASGAYDNTIRLWDVSTGKEKEILTGHKNYFRSVSFSPDCKTLASGASDNTIRLWDVSTGDEKALMTGHTSSVGSVSFSPDGKTLASGSWDNTIRLWDVSTGKEKGQLTGHTDYIRSVIFSPDGESLASGSYDKTIRLWDVSTGEEKALMTGHTDSIISVSFSSDGKILASGSYDKSIRLWDVSTIKEKGRLLGHMDYIRSVSFSPDGKILASGSNDKTIRLWDVSTGKEKGLITGHTDYVNSVCFSPDGKTLASGASDKTIRLWDVSKSNVNRTMTGHASSVGGVSFSPEGKTLASGSSDKTIRLWDVLTGKEKKRMIGHTFPAVGSVNFSPNGKTLVSGSDDNTIHLWDVLTGEEKRMIWLTSSNKTVNLSFDGAPLVSGSNENTSRFLETVLYKENEANTGHLSKVRSVSFSPDGKTFASGSSDKTIRLWDVSTGDQKALMIGHTSSVGSVSFAPDGKTLASGSWDNTIRLWDVSTGKEKGLLTGHTSKVRSVSFSADGKTLASGSDDKTIRLWDVLLAREKELLTGHTSSVRSVIFSPEGKSLASGSSDNTIRIWDVSTGKEKGLLTGHTDYVVSVSFSPDGKTLTSASNDKTIRLWNLSFYYKVKNKKLSEAEVKEAEQMYNLKLVNQELQPIQLERNLYGVKPQPVNWPKTHPFHWLSEAEKGDAGAMFQLGVIYDRDNSNVKALYWYQKAANAGNAYSGERLEFLKKWIERNNNDVVKVK